MNISALFIRRPVATILLSLALTLAGIFAYRTLPVAALPRVDFPTISVSAQLPGASPETMATSVATPLIKQFSTIAGDQSITSTSIQGATSITLEFDLNRDIDQAAADVQAAIARTQRRLPIEMTTPPSYRKLNPADAPILLLALRSDRCRSRSSTTSPQTVISPALSTINGVGQVLIFGSQKYAVRIQLDPTALTARGIGVDEIAARRRGGQRQHAGRHRRGQRQNLTIDGQDPAHQRRRLPRSHRRHPQRPSGAPRRHRRGRSTASRTTRSRAGTTASARLSSRCSASPTPTRSRSSTASAPCCRSSKPQLPPGADDRACSTTARPRSARPCHDVAVHAGADDRPRDPGDLPLPAAGSPRP